MLRQATQCPHCGNIFIVEPAAGTATCPACGVRLRISRASSGHYLARPLEPPSTTRPPEPPSTTRPLEPPSIARPPEPQPTPRPPEPRITPALVEALAARRALAGQLRERLQELAAERQEIDSQIEPATLAAAGRRGNRLTLRLATIGAALGALLSCLVLLGMFHTLTSPYYVPNALARSGLLYLLPAVALTVVAWLYRGHFLLEEERWQERYAEGQRKAGRLYGPDIARIDQEARSAEARLGELEAEIQDLERQVRSR